MLRDVTIEIKDGQLGVSERKGDGVHVKIGVSPKAATEEPIIVRGSANTVKIKELLGDCPLAEAVGISTENGSNRILCIPVIGSVAGSVGEVTAKVKNNASLTVKGKPHNSFDVVIAITAAGGLNTAKFICSTNAGHTWSEERTVPLSGEYELPGTGLTVTFATTGTFEVEDTFSFATNAAKMNSQDILNGLAKCKMIEENFEFVHIVGECTKEIWAAVSAEQQNIAANYHKNFFVVLEAYKKGEESLETYVSKLVTESKVIQNEQIQVVVARSFYETMGGMTKDINNAAVVAGMYSRATVAESIGKTSEFSVVGKMKALLPLGILEYVSELDDAKYLTFRTYDGLNGYFVNNARMMCKEGSDYRYAEDVRVRNKIVKRVRQEALLQLQEDIDVFNLENELSAKAKFIEASLEDMIAAKEVSTARIELGDNRNILVDETLHVIIRYIPRGKIREIIIDLGVENPYRTRG